MTSGNAITLKQNKATHISSTSCLWILCCFSDLWTCFGSNMATFTFDGMEKCPGGDEDRDDHSTNGEQLMCSSLQHHPIHQYLHYSYPAYKVFLSHVLYSTQVQCYKVWGFQLILIGKCFFFLWVSLMSSRPITLFPTSFTHYFSESTQHKIQWVHHSIQTIIIVQTDPCCTTLIAFLHYDCYISHQHFLFSLAL